MGRDSVGRGGVESERTGVAETVGADVTSSSNVGDVARFTVVDVEQGAAALDELSKHLALIL